MEGNGWKYLSKEQTVEDQSKEQTVGYSSRLVTVNTMDNIYMGSNTRGVMPQEEEGRRGKKREEEGRRGKKREEEGRRE